MKDTQISLFEEKKVRKIRFQEQWYFAIVDIITILTDSLDSGAYWRKIKQRLKEEGNETVTNCHTLKFLAQDGKMRSIDAGNTEECLRIIQSIPSPKAEPFKQRLAKVGYERMKEIENPELAQERMKLLYEQKGYPKNWIDKRLRGIAVRQDLTDEWKNRGVQNEIDYAILTNEITKATFGMSVKEYKKYKGLKTQNLRDHMTDLELILTMLGEAATTKFHKDRDSQTFQQLTKDARDGGNIAGRTKKDIEKQDKKSIVSKENYLTLTQNKKH